MIGRRLLRVWRRTGRRGLAPCLMTAPVLLQVGERQGRDRLCLDGDWGLDALLSERTHGGAARAEVGKGRRNVHITAGLRSGRG
jgi:hypothetical protein